MFLNILTIASILTTLNAYYIKNDITCVPNKVIPHPTDCGRFIKCGYTDNTNIVLNCTYPTLFNRRILDCDRPQNVFCQTYNFVPREESIIETIQKKEPEKVYCPRGCLFPHSTDCNRFIQCGETLKENKEFRCPTSMLYNHLITGCDLAQNVICMTYNYIFISDDKIESQNQIFIEQKPQAVSNATNNVITNGSELITSTEITTEVMTTNESNINVTTEPFTTMESNLETSSTPIVTTEESTMESNLETSSTPIVTTEESTMESILETSSTPIVTTEESTMESQNTEVLTTNESDITVLTTESISDGNFKDFNETNLIVTNSLSNVSRIEMIDRFNNTIELNYIITNESDSNLLISETSPPQSDFTESIVKKYFLNYFGKLRNFFIH